MQPLILCWWNLELRLVYPSGEVHSHLIDESSEPTSDILTFLGSEASEIKRIRIIYNSEHLGLYSLKHLEIPVPEGRNSKRKRSKLKRLLLMHYPQLSNEDNYWSLTYDFKRNPNYASLAITTDSNLKLLCKNLLALGYFIEGMWPLPFLMNTSQSKLSHEIGSLCVACTDKNFLITTVSPSGDWQCDNFATSADESITLSGLRNARLRFDDEAAPQGWIATDSSSEKNPLTYYCRELGLNNIMLSQVLHKSLFLPEQGWENMNSENISRKKFSYTNVYLPITAALLIATSALYFWYNSKTEKNRIDEKFKLQVLERQALSKQKEAVEIKIKSESVNRDYNLIFTEPQGIDTLLTSISQTFNPPISLKSLYLRDNIIYLESAALERNEFKIQASELCHSLNEQSVNWNFLVEPETTKKTSVSFKGSRLKTYMKPLDVTDLNLQELQQSLINSNALNLNLSNLATHWRTLSHTINTYTLFQIHKLELSYNQPRIEDWSKITQDIHTVLLMHNTMIDELLLTADTENPNLFKEVRINFSTRTKL